MSLDKVRTLLNFSTPTIPAISLKENESEGDIVFNTRMHAMEKCSVES